MFFSKWAFKISRACGVNEVRLLRFLDGSLPINSVRFCIPARWRASASAIHRSSTGFIFWALLGVMSSFSNLAGYKRPGFSLAVRLLAIVFSWASCGRKKWLLRMVCLRENWERRVLHWCSARVGLPACLTNWLAEVIYNGLRKLSDRYIYKYNYIARYLLQNEHYNKILSTLSNTGYAYHFHISDDLQNP